MNYQPNLPDSSRAAEPQQPTPARAAGSMNDNLTPKAVVAALDAHIIGQDRGQARGRGGAAQPLAPPAACPKRCATR